MTHDDFEFAIEEALDQLPPPLRAKMENVEIFVEEFPDRDTLDHFGLDSPYELLGLYQGTPVPERSFFRTIPAPDRIFLYRAPILYNAGDEDAAAVIRSVLIHEVGHHFGFDDVELYRMERETR